MVQIDIWNGTTPTRKNLSDIKNPDHEDYIRVVIEMQKIQTVLLTLIKNLALIPNLQGEFNAAMEKIEVVRQKIVALTPPQDLKNTLESIEKTLLEQDKRKDIATLRRDLEAFRVQIDKNQLQVLELQEVVATQVTAFQSKIWNIIKKQNTDFSEQLEEIKKKLESISIQTRIQTLIEELKNNERRD